MVVADGTGLPLGNYRHSASPAEVRLAETTLQTIRVCRRHRAGRPRQKPERVIAGCRHSTAENHNLRIKKAHKISDSETEKPAAAVENVQRQPIMLARGVGDIPSCDLSVLRTRENAPLSLQQAFPSDPRNGRSRN